MDNTGLRAGNGWFTLIKQPPCSPHSTPSDYYLQLKVKKKLNGCHFDVDVTAPVYTLCEKNSVRSTRTGLNVEGERLDKLN